MAPQRVIGILQTLLLVLLTAAVLLQQHRIDEQQQQIKSIIQAVGYLGEATASFTKSVNPFDGHLR